MFSSVTSSVSSWLGATKPDDSVTEESKNENNETSAEEIPDKNTETSDRNGSEKDIQQQMDEMGHKAVNTAKEWGSWLLDVGKNATTEVVKTANTVKKTVEEKTILGDFQKEQEKFVTENKEKQNKSEAAVPPWVGYNEEESMKQQIMALSTDQRNFMRNPPAGVQFHFDFEASFPVAMATLQEDPNLKKMRFDLVPKQVKEEMFWRNYFYRVSLIKQSAQLTTLAHQAGSSGEHAEKKTGDADSSATSSAEATSSSDQVTSAEAEELTSSSPPDNEFISDAFQSQPIDEEALKKEMQQLGMADGQEDVAEWERELQAELQEYEVVGEGEGDDMDDADLEQEILQQIEAEAKQ